MSTSKELTVSSAQRWRWNRTTPTAELKALAESSKCITEITNRAGREKCQLQQQQWRQRRLAQRLCKPEDRARRRDRFKAVIAEEAPLSPSAGRVPTEGIAPEYGDAKEARPTVRSIQVPVRSAGIAAATTDKRSPLTNRESQSDRRGQDHRSSGSSQSKVRACSRDETSARVEATG